MKILLKTLLSIVIIHYVQTEQNCSNNLLHNKIDGNVTIPFILNVHSDDSCIYALDLGKTQLEAAIWTVERINTLHLTNDFTMGLNVYDSCSNIHNEINKFMEIYIHKNKCSLTNYFTPIIAVSNTGQYIEHPHSSLNISVIKVSTVIENEIFVDVVIKFIISKQIKKNIILHSSNKQIKALFLNTAKEACICIHTAINYTNFQYLNPSDSNLMILYGHKSELQNILKTNFTNITLLIIPLDGSADLQDVPKGSYIILPLYTDNFQFKNKIFKLTPTPILFSIASPILHILHSTNDHIKKHCTDNIDRIECLNSNSNVILNQKTKIYPPNVILKILKIEPLKDNFVFYIFEYIDDLLDNKMLIEKNILHTENIFKKKMNVNTRKYYYSKRKIATYNIFSKTLFIYDNLSNISEINCWTSSDTCINNCTFSAESTKFNVMEDQVILKFRQNIWIASLISVAIIGFLCVIAIIMFICVRLCKGDILEGNPSTSIFLLITVILMYLSIIPFCVTFEVINRNEIDFNLIKGIKNNSKFQNPTHILTENNYKKSTSTNILFSNKTEVFSSYSKNNSLSSHIKSEISSENNQINPTNIILDTNKKINISNSKIYINNSVIIKTKDTNDKSINTENILFNTSALKYVNYSQDAKSCVEQHSNKRIVRKFENINSSNPLLKEYDNESTEEKYAYYSNMICLCGLLSMSTTYSLAFSIMLSRFIMLATVANETNLMSHINGYIQATLCFFMLLVQLGISLGIIFHQKCLEILTNSMFFILIAYENLLLFLLLLLCPFIIKSQRNYKEGLLFTITTIILVLVWIAWITLYCIVKSDWKETVIIFGLVSIATTILIGLFIPRTYLMMNSIIRDDLTNALPSLVHTQNQNLFDLNTLDPQVSYDYRTPTLFKIHMRDISSLHQINNSSSNEYPQHVDGDLTIQATADNIETTEEINSSCPTENTRF